MTSAPTAAQIADLLAWARRLSDTRRINTTTEIAAYQTAKAELLARIAATNSHPTED